MFSSSGNLVPLNPRTGAFRLDPTEASSQTILQARSTTLAQILPSYIIPFRSLRSSILSNHICTIELASRVLRAIDSIHAGMSSNRLSLSLSLNTGKTQLIWLQWYEAQSCQERNGSTLQSASIPDRTYIREEFWFHYRSRVKHEGPYHQTLPVVLPPASSNTHGSTLTYIISHPNFGPCLHLHASQFLQQPSQGPTSLTVSNRS